MTTDNTPNSLAARQAELDTLLRERGQAFAEITAFDNLGRIDLLPTPDPRPDTTPPTQTRENPQC